VIQSKLNAYLDAPTKVAKTSIITDVVLEMRDNSESQQGFVRHENNKNGDCTYALVEDAAARMAVAQGFRDAASPSYKSSKQAKRQKRMARRTGSMKRRYGLEELLGYAAKPQAQQLPVSVPSASPGWMVQTMMDQQPPQMNLREMERQEWTHDKANKAVIAATRGSHACGMVGSHISTTVGDRFTSLRADTQLEACKKSQTTGRDLPFSTQEPLGLDDTPEEDVSIFNTLYSAFVGHEERKRSTQAASSSNPFEPVPVKPVSIYEDTAPNSVSPLWETPPTMFRSAPRRNSLFSLSDLQWVFEEEW